MIEVLCELEADDVLRFEEAIVLQTSLTRRD
jgi:hypothetical protein